MFDHDKTPPLGLPALLGDDGPTTLPCIQIMRVWQPDDHWIEVRIPVWGEPSVTIALRIAQAAIQSPKHRYRAIHVSRLPNTVRLSLFPDLPTSVLGRDVISTREYFDYVSEIEFAAQRHSIVQAGDGNLRMTHRIELLR